MLNIRIMIAAILAIVLVSSFSSAFVIRNVTAERKAELARYEQYKADYIQVNDLKGYEQFIYEPNLIRNFGFYPASRYAMPASVYKAKYYPPLQGEIYSTSTRQYASSLEQPNAVKYYGENVNGRVTGFVQPDLNGVYFDHPDANKVYGVITYPGAVGCVGCTVAGTGTRFYARVADQVSDDYYAVGYY